MVNPWTSHNQYEAEMAAADKATGALYAKYKGMKVEDVAKDPAAMTIGKNLFDTYCIQCLAQMQKARAVSQI